MNQQLRRSVNNNDESDEIFLSLVKYLKDELPASIAVIPEYENTIIGSIPIESVILSQIVGNKKYVGRIHLSYSINTQHTYFDLEMEMLKNVQARKDSFNRRDVSGDLYNIIDPTSIDRMVADLKAFFWIS